MPRTKLAEARYAAEDFQREVRVRCAYYNLSVPELAIKVGIPVSTLYRKIRNPASMSVSDFKKLVIYLGMDVSVILPMVGISAKKAPVAREGSNG